MALLDIGATFDQRLGEAYRPTAENAHLLEFDASKAPRSEWPEGVDAWYQDYMKKQAERRRP